MLPFPEALMALLELRRHPAYNPAPRLTGRRLNASLLARQMPTTHRETLRKAISGERKLDGHLLEELAAALEVEPDYFAEYRLIVVREAADPDVVGLADAIETEREISAELLEKTADVFARMTPAELAAAAAEELAAEAAGPGLAAEPEPEEEP